jgi:hypothetical protein
MKKILVILAMLPFFASAGLFTITCNEPCPLGGQEVFNLIADEVNKNLPSASSRQEYLDGMSTANAMSAAGVATSYGTVFNRFLIGVTASGGAHLGTKSWSDFNGLTKNPEQFRGFGLQAAVVLGANFGRLIGSEGGGAFDPTKLNIYLTGFKVDKKFGDINAAYTGFGAGAQYRLIDPKSWTRLVKWTGLDVGAGLLYSKLKVDALINLDKTYSTTYQGNPATAAYTGNALLNADVSTMAIPLELSSGIRFLGFLKFIGGLGVDLNLGNTEAKSSLNNSSISANYDAGGPQTANGTAEFDVNGDSAPKFANLRVFAGPHIEFGVGSIFMNLHKSLLENAIAVNAGLNFFW